MIEIKDLYYSYKDRNNALNNIHLNIEKNEKITLIGRSGSGKSTLLYVLGGIYAYTNGSIKINQEELIGVREKTSMVFQHGGLFPWKTVTQNLELPLKTRKISKEQRLKSIESILTELDIQSIKHSYINRISGGQRQRVAIARSLLLQSDLLLLDEPSASLDAITKENFQSTMLRMFENHSLTSILVTHNIEEAVLLGEKIIIMNDGSIEQIIENEMFGKKDLKNTVEFYEKCIDLRKRLGL